ncbi:hypothetical protein RUM43_000673 [Polyplax serrata]|uniref:Uncharacterized protein n=1 Tax=Polyplax serrata TaxID=468196 RepID=A0AAN8SEC8_POLSC
MKKEEKVQKENRVKDLKINQDHRSRSYSPKAYHGCDTCKFKNGDLKKIKSISKFSDYTCQLDKNKNSKFKKNPQERDKESKEESKREKIKLTDLCDDDKKKIVELIEELSKFADKNQKLNEMIDRMHKIRQEQQDYIMKQANIHLEEKNIYVNEINEYKCKLETVEMDMKSKVLQWEKHERFMDAQIAYFAKALQESKNEKNDLNEQMSHLKNCLRQSLDSFQRLRKSMLQTQDKLVKQFKSVSCQTETEPVEFRSDLGDSDAEFLLLNNKNDMEAKSSLDVINDKLESVYQLLKGKSEHLTANSPKNIDVDFSALLNDGPATEKSQNLINSCQDELLKEKDEQEVEDVGYKFLKPYSYCSKTSLQAERILKKIGKPLSLNTKKVIKGPRCFDTKESNQGETIIQKNSLFQHSNEHLHWIEDKLLQDLFYTDGNLKLGP